MLKKTVQDAINEQIKDELYSSYLYLSMSTCCETINLLGSAHWMRLQSQEEYSHAMRLFDYINDRGGRVVLQTIDQPPSYFTVSPLGIFKQVLSHEQKVTGKIHRLYELSVEENDYATQVVLQWFITEQVEEEKVTAQIIEQLKMIGDQDTSLLMLDRHLGERGVTN